MIQVTVFSCFNFTKTYLHNDMAIFLLRHRLYISLKHEKKKFFLANEFLVYEFCFVFFSFHLFILSLILIPHTLQLEYSTNDLQTLQLILITHTRLIPNALQKPTTVKNFFILAKIVIHITRFNLINQNIYFSKQ